MRLTAAHWGKDMANACNTPLDRAALFVCHLGVAGRSPKAPGTCGSALAALLAPFLFLPLGPAGRVAVLLGVFVLGALAANRVERALCSKDPGEVVVDELVGQWLTFLPFATVTPLQIVAGFCLFRLFDIAKPWPVKASERWLPGGWGIMIDDVVAGMQAVCVLGVLRWMGLP